MSIAEELEAPPSIPKPDELDAQILDLFDDFDAPPVEDESGHRRLHDPGQADWALRKLAAVEAKRAEVNALATRQVEYLTSLLEPWLTPILEWQAAEIARLDGRGQFFESLLTSFHLEQLADDPRAKTIRLPHGTLTSRMGQPQWAFEDAAFLAWAEKSAPEFVRTTAAVDKALAKKTLRTDEEGRVVYALPSGPIDVPGVTVTPGLPSFTVSTEEVAQ